MHIIIHYYKGLGFSERLWVDYTSEKELLVPERRQLGPWVQKFYSLGVGEGRDGLGLALPVLYIFFLDVLRFYFHHS